MTPLPDPSPSAPLACPGHHATLPEHMLSLQTRFLTAENVDAFLSIQDAEVLEFFHQSYNKNGDTAIENS